MTPNGLIPVSIYSLISLPNVVYSQMIAYNVKNHYDVVFRILGLIPQVTDPYQSRTYFLIFCNSLLFTPSPHSPFFLSVKLLSSLLWTEWTLYIAPAFVSSFPDDGIERYILFQTLFYLFLSSLLDNS